VAKGPKHHNYALERFITLVPVRFFRLPDGDGGHGVEVEEHGVGVVFVVRRLRDVDVTLVLQHKQVWIG
jgi:hypothetical protein